MSEARSQRPLSAHFSGTSVTTRKSMAPKKSVIARAPSTPHPNRAQSKALGRAFKKGDDEEEDPRLAELEAQVADRDEEIMILQQQLDHEHRR